MITYMQKSTHFACKLSYSREPFFRNLKLIRCFSTLEDVNAVIPDVTFYKMLLLYFLKMRL